MADEFAVDEDPRKLPFIAPQDRNQTIPTRSLQSAVIHPEDLAQEGKP